MTQTSVNPIPEGMHSVTPHLVCAGAAAAIDFYRVAFAAAEVMRVAGPEGKLMHAAVRIGDSTVMLMDEAPQWGALGPKSLNATPVSLHLYVEDVDAAFARAVDAGATVKMEPADMFWGDRYGVVTDPFGHLWSLATHTHDLSPDQIEAAAQQQNFDCPAADA